MGMILFKKYGAHVLVDGQYGSTGKGVLASYLAQKAMDQGIIFDAVVSSAGPNSGHTFYHSDRKIVLKQLPTFAVATYLMGHPIPVYLSAGAVINPHQLRKEMEDFPGIPVFVHPRAAVISDDDLLEEHSGTIAEVAGTRQGVGAAIARKVRRDPSAVAATALDSSKFRIGVYDNKAVWESQVFVEVSQGFSLGLNQPFYPKVTSRECTVAQAIADAALPPRSVTMTYMSLRTYPIRVGNVGGVSSGGWYLDQKELTWDTLGVEPERTTVTNRIRRVATFSEDQLRDAMDANDPDVLFLNFMNYPGSEEVLTKLGRVILSYENPPGVLLGYGSRSSDVVEA